MQSFSRDEQQRLAARYQYMTTEALLAEIRLAFPPVKMPRKSDLRFHREGCFHCDYLARDLDKFRGEPVGGAVIWVLHRELSSLSAKGWAWALPHYLPFCLASEAGYNQTETEFLLYSLAPLEKFEAETRVHLSALSRLQVTCLVHFVEWLKGHPHWSTYCPSEIEEALDFLKRMEA
ncbi:hypothetical protein RBA41_12360 [Massilia sp. CCM 9210]|uniref:hypothetical protein n=1 Tax=Massilia scottii TaxID=3057166 RepID=UPI0027964AD1|nr:hypothetical protein [Massilia sp. CCM 9210]MDQ1814100.1 hypothetical protein [Massilia sp. CCM 9210]